MSPASTDTPAAHPAPPQSAITVAGVPWVTAALLFVCMWVLVAAGGLRTGLSLQELLAAGAKATPLLLDRGETWRLLTANLLHKDILHLVFNGFAIWNVGGALERAVRPADYLALLLVSALGTTVASAAGSDAISLGASGIAFGLLGASAAFGWRRRVRGPMRAYFGLNLIPWLLALFGAGLGSTGVDNWGHAGGLVSGVAVGMFLAPRGSVGEGPVRRLAAASALSVGSLFIGLVVQRALPVLGAVQLGPSGLEVRLPLGWRPAGGGADRVSFSNGLPSRWRSAVLIGIQGEPVATRSGACAAGPCGCGAFSQEVKTLAEEELGRLADRGSVRGLDLAEPRVAMPLGPGAAVLEGLLAAEDGPAHVSAACLPRGAFGPPAIVVALEPPREGEAPEELAGKLAAAMSGAGVHGALEKEVPGPADAGPGDPGARRAPSGKLPWTSGPVHGKRAR